MTPTEVTLREYFEQRFTAIAERDTDFRAYAEKRWTDLNGEAGRLKTILEASVPLVTFHAYQVSQRDKEDAREKAQRERLEAYIQAHAEASLKYSEDVGAKLSAINMRIATFVGGGLALIAALQLWLNYGR